MSHACRIHIIYEPLRDGTPGPRASPLKAIAVPDHPRYLTINDAGAPRLSADPCPTAALVVEPVYDGVQPKLLLLNLSPGGAPARINGRPAPRAALLSVADQIRFDDYLLHVTSYNRPRVGPVASDAAGGRCPICSLPFEAGDVAYSCSNCPGRLHLKSRPRGKKKEVLRCATLVRECSTCHRRIDLTEGWAFVPDAR